MPLTQVSSRLIEDTLRYVLGANGTSDYTFTGKGLTGAVNDPTLTLSRGHTYIFENRSGGHPFYIKTSIANGGTNDAYNTGVTNNGGGNGTEIVFTVPHDAPDVLYYQCSSHSSMNGQLNIVGAVTDGSITTAKLAADAVDGTKIADAAINSEHYVDGSIDTAHIANSQITNAKLADNSVSTDRIVDGAVNANKLGNAVVTTAKIDNSAVTNDKIASGISSSKLTGALPALDGSALTGISGGLEMAQEWKYGSYPLYYTDAELNGTWNATAASVGSAMTVSSGVFTFPSTGIYRIFSSITSNRLSNESRYMTIFTYLSTDGGSNWTLQRENYGNINNDTSSISTFTNSVILDITNTSTHKVKFKVASETQVALSTTYVQFFKLGDT